MERFGIREKDLPSGSLLINRPPGFLQKYSTEIIIVSSFFLMAFLYLLIRFLQQRRHEKYLYHLNRQLEEKVREKTVDLVEKIDQIETKNAELQNALDQIRTLKGIIPICAHCKNVRNDEGYWKQVEQYVSENTDAVFSHGLCPDCLRNLYPDEADEINKSGS